MKLRAGLMVASPQWEQILHQEGFPVAVVDFEHFNQSEWSFLIINCQPTSGEVPIIAGYLEEGGAILACSGHATEVFGTSGYRAGVQFVTSRRGELFEDMGILDLETDCLVSREANLLPTESGSNSVFAGKIGKGYAVDLPFDPSELMFDARRSMRLFYAGRDRIPAEDVSTVGKGELRFLLHRVFEFLHHARGLQYAHLWYYPGGGANIFAFRIDTDGAPQSQIEELHGLASKHHTPFSWFLDVKSHDQWLQVFRLMEGHEVGLHCYEHVTYDSRDDNKQNMAKALKMMNGAGLTPEGFSAPYGQWNTGLAQAIDELGFLYSSEFSYAYDTLPLYPESGGQRFSALQIPIHPVCIGSMHRVGYNEQQMKEYFRRSVDWKLCRSEPLFYYHHPGNGCLNVIEDLIEYVHQRGIATITMAGFAKWWRKREEVHIGFETTDEGVEFKAFGSLVTDPIWVEVTTPDGLSCRLPLSAGRATRTVGDWQPVCRTTPPPDIRRTREFDARARLGQWYNSFLRKFR